MVPRSLPQPQPWGVTASETRQGGSQQLPQPLRVCHNVPSPRLLPHCTVVKGLPLPRGLLIPLLCLSFLKVPSRLRSVWCKLTYVVVYCPPPLPPNVCSCRTRVSSVPFAVVSAGPEAGQCLAGSCSVTHSWVSAAVHADHPSGFFYRSNENIWYLLLLGVIT